MPKSAEPFVHLTFATEAFSQAVTLLRQSARRFGVDDLRAYQNDHPVIERLRREHPAIMAERRGAGYWMWKPFIISDTLDRVPEGTVVLYTDAAMVYIGDPAPLIALAHQHDVIAFTNAKHAVQRARTKRDCFILLDADRPEEWERRQLDAAYLLVRAGKGARSFLDEWGTALADPRVVTDQENTCGLPNLDGFIEHRHDQSVLTIIAARRGIPAFEAPGRIMRGRSTDVPYGVVFHQHRSKNVHPLHFAARVVGLHLRLWPPEEPVIARRRRKERAKEKLEKARQREKVRQSKAARGRARRDGGGQTAPAGPNRRAGPG